MTKLSTGSLKKKVVSGVKWQLVGQLFTQGWRFASNLILTRLLLPDAFGVAAIIFGIIFAVRMLSDVGLRDTVIHNERGDDPTFLNTVWTIQIIRGFLLSGLVSLLAFPMAQLYDEPRLLWLMPIAGLGPIINGFISTSLLTAGRHIFAKWIVVTNLSGNLVGTVSMIIVAFFTNNVIALVIGSLVNVLTMVFVSYQFGEHRKHHLTWNREAAAAVSHFGRWTVPSSFLTIFMQQGDKLVLGVLMTKTSLGLYSIGANLAFLAAMVFDRVSAAILQPVHSKVKDQPIEEARGKIRRFRLYLLSGLLPGIWALILGGHWIFRLLYREEFHDAYLYCSITGFGIALRIASDMGPILQAHGYAKRYFQLTLVRFFTLAVCMLVGYFVNGPFGLICGIALSPLAYYPFQAREYHKLGMWQPEVDAIGVVPSIMVMALFFAFGGI